MRIELPDEIYCGLATMVTLRLVNAKRFFPSFLLDAKILGKSFTANLVRGGEAEAGSFVIVFPERGRVAIPCGEIRSPFPINFFVRRRKIALDRQITVFPAPRTCAVAEGRSRSGKSGDFISSRKGYEGDVTRISEYTGSEPMKLIHWRLSAKHEEFKVKEMNATFREPVIIDINAMPGRELEEHLSCAAFLINRLIRANRPVGLKLPERIIEPALSREHRLGLLAELAVYGKN